MQIAACGARLGQAEQNKVLLNRLPRSPEIMTHPRTHVNASAALRGVLSLCLAPSPSHLFNLTFCCFAVLWPLRV